MNARTKALVTASIAGAALLGSARTSDACSCFSSGPPCQAAWAVEAVFVGVVRANTLVPVDTPTGRQYSSRRVQIDVEKEFRNAAPGRIEISTAMHGAACGYEFAVGRRYLVYAHKDLNGGLLVSLCSRTRPIEEAAGDLRYLASIPATGGGGRVFGRVKQYERDPAEEIAVDYGPVEGVRVFLRGPDASRETITNEHGRFEIDAVSPGQYTLAVTPPVEFSQRYLEREVSIGDPRACFEADFTVRYEARASGRITTAGGAPIEGVRIEAIAAEQATSPRRSDETRTDASGAFELVDLAPGAYVIAVNVTRPPDAKSPFPVRFLPGTAKAADAAVIELKPGDRRELGSFRLGEALREYPISGCVAWPDGRAVAHGYASLHAADNRPWQVGSVALDQNGCFNLVAHEGMSYRVSVSAHDGTTYGSAQLTISVRGPQEPARVVLQPRR